MKQLSFLRVMTFVAVILFFPIVFSACLKSNDPGLPANVVQSIAETGFNRIELTKTVAHYLEENDSIGLKAAFYLISNMGWNYSVVYQVNDSTGETYQIDPTAFSNGQSMLDYWDSLDIAVGGLLYEPLKFQADRDTVKADKLIENINNSLIHPWVQIFHDTIIFQYILPYRIGNELIEYWKSPMLSDHSWLLKAMDTAHPVASLTQLINHHTDSLFHFDKRFVKQAHTLSYDEIKHLRRGNYTDLAYQKIRMLRTFGIPATLDYTPLISDTNQGFSWAVAMNIEGDFVPLLPPGTEHLFNHEGRIPKVYRRIFHNNENSLFAKKKREVTTPPFIGHFHYKDVTHEYFSTSEVLLNLSCPDTLVYLAVWNDDEWKAVDWAICRNNQAHFNHLAIGSKLRPVYLKNKRVEVYGEPFVLKEPDE
jgi:hypothetical protein